MTGIKRRRRHLKPRLHQGNMLPGNTETCCRQHVACCRQQNFCQFVARLLLDYGYKGIHVAEIQATCCRQYRQHGAGNEQHALV